jgi:1,4-alpha-glucan branching enzyme
MTTIGVFSFVLHSHMPYARLAGRWPHGEEWIHEAATETYIPLLQALYDLRAEGVPFRLTLGITPVLAEQLQDQLVLDNLNVYLDSKIEAAKRDLAHYADPKITHMSEQNMPEKSANEVNAHMHYLAGWYKSWYENIKDAFNERFDGNILGAFKTLQDEGYIEIITSAATHAYLPLLSRDSSIRAQVKTALATHERHFGQVPKGFWLPECAYRPAYLDEDDTLRVGLETWLEKHDLRYFFTETHAIVGGQPVGVAGGDVIGPYGVVKRRYVIPQNDEHLPQRSTTTFQPYFVRDTSQGGEKNISSQVAVLGRNRNTGHQVWSSDWGYPGDFDYREFYKKAGTSGLHYWRVTGDKTDLEHKDYYHPEWAGYKIEQHAEHFAHLVGDLLRDYHKSQQQVGMITASFDTELFGHWWFEGVNWLREVLRHLAQNPDIGLMTTSEYLESYPPQETLQIPESSWGTGGYHFTWDNADTHWMWEPIHACELRMEQLAQKHLDAEGDAVEVLNQAARELLLLQSSDWSFLVTTQQAKEYAIQRFSQHVERFNTLADSLEQGTPNVDLAREYKHLDNLFPDIDYRWFAEAADNDS